MTLDSWNEPSFDWKYTTAANIKYYGAHYLIGIFNDLDKNKTDKSSIYVNMRQYFYYTFTIYKLEQ